MPRRKLLILGNSAAGLSALRAIRQWDQSADVTLVDREEQPAYSRVITPYYVGGKIEREKLFLCQKDFYGGMGVKALLGEEAVALEPERRRLILKGGRELAFDSLLIAVGAYAVKPDIKGIDSPGVCRLNSLSDADDLRERAREAREVVAIGGGRVNLPVLDHFLDGRRRLSVVENSPQILSRMLDEEGASLIEEEMKRKGVEVHKGREVFEIEKTNGCLRLRLNDGQKLTAHLVLVGIGVLPEVDFLRNSGLEIETGIIVNSRMQTNFPNIYAAGDAVEGKEFFTGNRVIQGIWTTAVEQGAVAGANMAGRKVDYEGSLRLTVATFFGLSAAALGLSDGGELKSYTFLDRPRGLYRKLFLDGKERLVGALMVGEIGDSGVLHGLMRSRSQVGEPLVRSLLRGQVRYGKVFNQVVRPLRPGRFFSDS